jgi:hypothetical protein
MISPDILHGSMAMDGVVFWRLLYGAFQGKLVSSREIKRYFRIYYIVEANEKRLFVFGSRKENQCLDIRGLRHFLSEDLA